MWGEVMSRVHSGLKAKQFENSSYASCHYYCTATGQLATSACPSKATGWYKKGSVPGVCKTHNGTALSSPNADKVDTKTPADEQKEKEEQEKLEEQQNSQNTTSQNE